MRSGTPSRSCSRRRRSSSAGPTTRRRRSPRRRRNFRQLGLGYANLGALLMALGLPYDSADGRAWAAAITSLMTGHAYATSARTASRMGPFAGFADNEEHMLRVLRMHRDASHVARRRRRRAGRAARRGQESWDAAVARRRGVRRAQLAGQCPGADRVPRRRLARRDRSGPRPAALARRSRRPAVAGHLG